MLFSVDASFPSEQTTSNFEIGSIYFSYSKLRNNTLDALRNTVVELVTGTIMKINIPFPQNNSCLYSTKDIYPDSESITVRLRRAMQLLSVAITFKDISAVFMTARYCIISH